MSELAQESQEHALNHGRGSLVFATKWQTSAEWTLCAPVKRSVALVGVSEFVSILLNRTGREKQNLGNALSHG